MKAPTTDPERDALDVRPTGERDARPRPRGGRRHRGRLRVYLGMAPGVGKTYRMLEEGHRRLARGTDLVVGFVEAHGRPHTLELLDGLEVVPRRRDRVPRRGRRGDGHRRRHRAGSRPSRSSTSWRTRTCPGSPRDKRWEDVEVIRDAGIHVVST